MLVSENIMLNNLCMPGRLEITSKSDFLFMYLGTIISEKLTPGRFLAWFAWR
jgi:hypothetical protein